MTKKNRQKPIKPDEVFVQGPLRVARYGKNIIYESHWPEGTHDEMQKRLVAQYPEIVRKIDGLVEEIATHVSKLPPEKLLHRAWWEFASRSIHIEAEVDIDVDDAISMRMIDYIQSIIVSVKPAEGQRDDVTDEEWHLLRENVDNLFQTLNQDYQICRTAKAKAEDENYDDDVEEFFYKAQVYWCNVRGDRYQVHENAYLHDMFMPHSAILQELFGITAEQFIGELTKIWNSLTFGVQESYEEMKSFQKDTMAAVDTKLAGASSHADVDLHALVQGVVTENGWQDRQELVMDRFLGNGLCDVKNVTSLPQALIDELTWRPGEETSFFATGEFCGWPLRIWPVFKRPFILLNGRYYCFDLHGLFDNIYRVMQRVIMRLKPDYRESWNELQKELSEEQPFEYLKEILPGAMVFRSVYYRWYTAPGSQEKNWCEADGLLLYDDCLFIVEARAGAFTYTSPANDFPAFIASLKNLVLKPATQGKRFLDYLASEEKISIFDEGHKKVGEISKTDYRQIVICPVTLDPFTEMAAQVQHLRKIGVDVGHHPVWAISLDDLRVYADIFENPLRFLHYIDQRMRAFRSDIIQPDDEFDHLGLYLKHNNYSLHAEELRSKPGTQINYIGYRSEIDKFFLERLYDSDAPCPLQQDTPARILEIINFLSSSAKPGRATLSGYILDLDGDTRQMISDCIEQELKTQPETKRPKPYSSHGEVNFTVYCYTQQWVRRDADKALDHTRTALLINSDEQRLLLELSYADEGVLADLNWTWVQRAAIPPQDLPRLQRAAEELRKVRVANAKSQRRKIGRNEQCPCGSGTKYKKCCLKKQTEWK